MQYQHVHHSFLSEDEIKGLYTQAVENGVRDVVFYDNEVVTADEWLQYLKDEDCWLVVCKDDKGDLAFFWWLNGYMGRSAMIHFCNWRLNRDELVEATKQAFQWLADQGHLHSVYGITPKFYRHVFPYIEACGFKVLGDLKGACYHARKKRYIDCKISSLDLRGVYGEKNLQQNCH